MRDPDLVFRAQRAASALERAWQRWRIVHGQTADPTPVVSSYVGYSLEDPWGQPRVVLGLAAQDAEQLAVLLDRHDCAGPAHAIAIPAQVALAGRLPGGDDRDGPVFRQVAAAAQEAAAAKGADAILTGLRLAPGLPGDREPAGEPSETGCAADGDEARDRDEARDPDEARTGASTAARHEQEEQEDTDEWDADSDEDDLSGDDEAYEDDEYGYQDPAGYEPAGSDASGSDAAAYGTAASDAAGYDAAGYGPAAFDAAAYGTAASDAAAHDAAGSDAADGDAVGRDPLEATGVLVRFGWPDESEPEEALAPGAVWPAAVSPAAGSAEAGDLGADRADRRRGEPGPLALAASTAQVEAEARIRAALLDGQWSDEPDYPYSGGSFDVTDPDLEVGQDGGWDAAPETYYAEPGYQEPALGEPDYADAGYAEPDYRGNGRHAAAGGRRRGRGGDGRGQLAARPETAAGARHRLAGVPDLPYLDAESEQGEPGEPDEQAQEPQDHQGPGYARRNRITRGYSIPRLSRTKRSGVTPGA